MTNIDPSRLSSIFRSLSSTDSLKPSTTEKKQDQLSTQSSPSVSIQKVVARDQDVLKRNLRERLKKLKAQNENFEKKAPLVTIREILLWEFGEDILNHPDFHHLTQIVTEQVANNEELLAYLRVLIANYSEA